jgi:hypothetical protein
MMKRLGRVDHGFVDINAMALNAAISASILAALKVYVATNRQSGTRRSIRRPPFGA